MHAKTPTGFLWGSRSARPLSPPEVARLQRVFAECYGGAPSDWLYADDARGSRLHRQGDILQTPVHEGYQLGPWVSDTLLALLALDEARALQPDNAVIAAYACATRPLTNERTARQGLTRLHALNGRTLDASGAWISQRATPPEEPRLERAFLCLDTAAEALRDALRESLRAIAVEQEHRQMSGGPTEVALELSGGLDSTLVGAIAREVFPSLRCVTVDGSAEGVHLDRPWAEEAARHLELPHDVLSRQALREIDASSPLNHAAPSLLPGDDSHRGLARYLAETHEVRLVLTGHGSDGLFALSPSDARRQRQQWGNLNWLAQVAKMTKQRGGLPSTQWLRQHFAQRNLRDRWDRMAPWYALDLEAELRESMEQQYAYRDAWETYWHGVFFPALAAQQHPGVSGRPLWHAHPFRSQKVVELTRQIPPWPHFDQKAVVRRALIQEGLSTLAARPKQTGTQADPWWPGSAQTDNPPASGPSERLGRLSSQLESLFQDPASYEQTWMDPSAFRHALTHWRRYPRILRDQIPYTLGALTWHQRLK